MTTLTLYHNPRCSKSREALALLEARSVDFQIRRYLDEPLSHEELVMLARRLDNPISALLRSTEDEWKHLALESPDDEQRLAAIANYPRLLQRPILDRGDRAIIGRPPEAILSLIDAA